MAQRACAYLGMATLLVVTGGCVSRQPSAVGYDNIELREAVFANIDGTRYPYVSVPLGRLLEQGGVLGFRDYLLFLGRKYPNVRDYYHRLPLARHGYYTMSAVDSCGKPWQQARRAAPSVAQVIDVAALAQAGILSEDKQYTYNDLARILETTLCDW